MLRVGFVGWRGMVGSVLLQRMQENNDFAKIQATFFSTSNVGGVAPNVIGCSGILQDAYNLESLAKLDCIITTQGSEYTESVLPKLRTGGYTGYWLDASSCLRMNDDNIIVLDPINRDVIDSGLHTGIKNFSGGNCTVSLMLMAIGGLFKHGLIEWLTSMTYQAASGAGAANMRELLEQSGVLYNSVSDLLNNPSSNILEIDQTVTQTLNNSSFPTKNFGAPLAGNVLPWIDKLVDDDQTKEEWKGISETNKILGLVPGTIKIDGLCVRVGSMRCHSQALTIKLTDKDLKIEEIVKLLCENNKWVKYVANSKDDTLSCLTPASISGKLDIAIGRLRRLNIGKEYITLFTVGDQLLWGAAEPLRRMLNILVDYHG